MKKTCFVCGKRIRERHVNVEFNQLKNQRFKVHQVCAKTLKRVRDDPNKYFKHLPNGPMKTKFKAAWEAEYGNVG